MVFAHFSQYLSHSLEKIQKRAMSIIYPRSRYADALARAGLSTLEARREETCRKLIGSINPTNPIFNFINPITINVRYNLISHAKHQVLCNTDRLKNFVTIKYL